MESNDDTMDNIGETYTDVNANSPKSEPENDEIPDKLDITEEDLE